MGTIMNTYVIRTHTMKNGLWVAEIEGVHRLGINGIGLSREQAISDAQKITRRFIAEHASPEIAHDAIFVVADDDSGKTHELADIDEILREDGA
jgi:hypothetical protein